MLAKRPPSTFRVHCGICTPLTNHETVRFPALSAQQYHACLHTGSGLLPSQISRSRPPNAVLPRGSPHRSNSASALTGPRTPYSDFFLLRSCEQPSETYSLLISQKHSHSVPGISFTHVCRPQLLVSVLGLIACRLSTAFLPHDGAITLVSFLSWTPASLQDNAFYSRLPSAQSVS